MPRFVASLMAFILTHVSMLVCTGDAAELAQLKETWERQQNEIVTAEIRYRYINTGAAHLKALSQQKVEQLIGAFDERRDAGLMSLATAVLLSPASGDLGEEHEFVVDGSRSRDDATGQLGDKRTHMVDGDKEVLHWAGSSPVDIHARGGSKMNKQTLSFFKY
jgi:hypothetical protein